LPSCGRRRAIITRTALVHEDAIPWLELSQSQSGELIINKNIAVVGPGANLLAVARGEKLISDQFGNVEASRERISFVREQRIHFCAVTSLQDLHDAEVKIRHDLA
jgi:hypothetical protein